MVSTTFFLHIRTETPLSPANLISCTASRLHRPEEKKKQSFWSAKNLKGSYVERQKTTGRPHGKSLRRYNKNSYWTIGKGSPSCLWPLVKFSPGGPRIGVIQ
jgi:hypothetical protein